MNSKNKYLAKYYQGKTNNIEAIELKKDNIKDVSKFISNSIVKDDCLFIPKFVQDIEAKPIKKVGIWAVCGEDFLIKTNSSYWSVMHKYDFNNLYSNLT